ncbi:MAG: amidohydrolase, partial [Bacteroidaceae bacterium]|nr:amidohydrolase [Bacteroidaceae bacterium]
SAEVFLSNMDYAQVGGAVVVQEVIDGNQNAYLTEVQKKYPERFFCMGMAWTLEEAKAVQAAGLKGIAFPGHRMKESLITLIPIFKYMEEKGMVLSMCLGESEAQIGEMKEVIQECPDLKVAIGHFGMVTTDAFESQAKLAREGKNVMVESGGITWLFNSEFYPYPSAIRSIKQATDWVGMDRLMWGSDYPRTITAITYRMSYDFVCKSKELTDQEKAAFLGENAERFYGFKNLPELPYIKNMSE